MEQTSRKGTIPLWDNHYQQLMEDLEMISQEREYSVVTKAQKALLACRIMMQSLQEYIIRYDFKTQAEEILFFREVKPKFHSQLLYFHKLFTIEIGRPVGNLEDQKSYLQKELDRIKEFFDDNKFLYHYYRSGETYLDEKLFLRQAVQTSFSRQIIDINAHPKFTTNSDYIFSKIRSNELLAEYIYKAIVDLSENILTPQKQAPPVKKIKWTDAKSALIELIYAFKAKGCFDNGKATLKDITDLIQLSFDIEISNPSRDFQEILRRKTGYTIYLDNLKDSYLKYIDSIENKINR